MHEEEEKQRLIENAIADAKRKAREEALELQRQMQEADWSYVPPPVEDVADIDDEPRGRRDSSSSDGSYHSGDGEPPPKWFATRQHIDALVKTKVRGVTWLVATWSRCV